MNPETELKTIQVKLGSIVDGAKSAGRELTTAEMDTIESGSARALQLKAAIDRGIKTAAAMDEFARSSSGSDDDVNHDVFAKEQFSRHNAKSGYMRFDKTSAKIAGQGIKALIETGSDGIPIEFAPDPIKIGQTGFGLLSLLPATQRASRKYDVLVQSVRTNNAAIVAAGGTKPTSTFTVKNVENVLQVIAHLSEPIDRFLLEDNDALERFVTGELENGVLRKATQLGVTTLSTTSGIQTVAFDGSAADSIYDGATAIQDDGYSPNLILVNSSDYKAMRKSKDGNQQYYAGGPFLGASDTVQPGLWGITTLVSPDVTVGKALVLDTSKVGVSTDKFGIRTDVDKSGGFAKNTVQFRTEGRFAFDVYTPSAVALVSLAAS